MERWWPFGKSQEEKPVRLPVDPADWSLGEGPEREEILSLLLRELRSPAPSHRERAVELLAEGAPEEATGALLSLLQREEHLIVRWKALHALEQLTGAAIETIESPLLEEMEHWREEVVDELLQQLTSDRASRRWSAAEALGQLGAPRAVPALVEALRDPHAFVRWAAVQALGHIHEKRTIPLLLTMVEDPDPLARRSALDALGFFDTAEARRALRRALHDADPTVRRNAIEAVARVGDPRAVAPLISALDRGDDLWMRYSAAEALGLVGDHRAIPPLIEATRDPHVLIRRAAVRSLGSLHDSRAIPPLLKALQDSDPQVRLYAADGLGRLGHGGILPQLDEHAHDTATAFGRQVGQAVQRAIEQIQERIDAE